MPPRPRRSISAATVLLIAAVTGMAAPSAPAAPAAPVSGVLYGASVATTTGSTAAASFATLESTVGRTLAVDRSYARWNDPEPTPLVKDDGAHGRTPLLSIKPQRTDGTIVTWAAIADGTHDADIRAQADGLRDSGIPLILAFQHEPELSSGYGAAADYVAAFRHYVAVFRAEGASNVAFAVVLGASTYANPARWYPGDDVVDWIGVDAYNFAACVPGTPAWRSLATAAGPFYAWAAPRGKPLVLAEWGSAEDIAVPGRKAEWIRDAAATLANWPQVKAASYFDRVGTCDWRLTTSTSAAAAFADVSHTAWANATPTARLVVATPVGAAPLVESLDPAGTTGGSSMTGTGIVAWQLNFGDGTPPATGTGQPTTVTHTYAAGHWTAALTVTDATGASATTSAPVVAAGPPTVAEGSPSAITATSATLPAWLNTSGLAGSWHVEWGRTTALGTRGGDIALPAVDKTQAVTYGLTGLAPMTKYYWRFVAGSAAGTTYGPVRTVVTAAG